MGTTLKDIKRREKQYRRQLREDFLSRASYIFINIIPALIRAAFDPTVRSVSVDINRPHKDIIVNSVVKTKDDRLVVKVGNIKAKKKYFEELLEWT